MRIAATILFASLMGCVTTQAEQAKPRPIGASLDRQIEALMTEEDVKGLAIAVIENDQITHLNAYGWRNVEKRLPLETDTIMYGASLTKTAFTYMVLQLVDEGRIDLERPIAEYLDRPIPEYEEWDILEGDEDWRRLTPRHVLSHTTGLANLRFFEPDHDLRFHFEPGTGYAYSGEGFWLLQLMVEEGLGLDVKAEMQHRVFDRFGMTKSDMQWRSDFADNLADGYAMDGSFEPHDERSTVSASGSMDTTIADQALMWRGILAGDGLSQEAREMMTTGQVGISTAAKFPTVEMHGSHDPRGPEVGLSAGLGVETWTGPHGPMFAKGGHNDWTGNLAICDETREKCLIMMANSVRAELIFPDIAKLVLGDTGYPWWWTYSSLHND